MPNLMKFATNNKTCFSLLNRDCDNKTAEEVLTTKLLGSQSDNLNLKMHTELLCPISSAITQQLRKYLTPSQ
jgi:hypothetical protein